MTYLIFRKRKVLKHGFFMSNSYNKANFRNTGYMIIDKWKSIESQENRNEISKVEIVGFYILYQIH